MGRYDLTKSPSDLEPTKEKATTGTKGKYDLTKSPNGKSLVSNTPTLASSTKTLSLGPRRSQEKTLSVKPLRDAPEFVKTTPLKAPDSTEPKSFFQRMAEYDPQGKFLPGNLDDTAVGKFLKRMNASQNEVRLGIPQVEKPDAPLSLAADLIGGALGFVGGGPGGAAGNVGAASFNLGTKAVEKLPLLSKAPRLVGTAAGLAGGSVAYDAARKAMNDEPITAKDIGMAAAQNAALGLIPFGVGKGLELRANSKAIKEADKLFPSLKSDPLADIQNAYRTPSLRDARQRELEELFANTPATERTGATPSSPAEYFRNAATQADFENLFGSPIKKYSFRTKRQQMYEDIFNGKPVPKEPAQYFGKVTKEDFEKVWGKPLRRYSVTPAKQREYENLFSENEAYFSPKRETAKANATPEMYFGNRTQADMQSAFPFNPQIVRNAINSGKTVEEVANELGMNVWDVLNALGDKSIPRAPQLITKEVPPSVGTLNKPPILQVRDLTNSRIGKPYPFELRSRTISEGSKGNVDLRKTVKPGQVFQPRTSEGLQPERITWTNRDNIPSAGPTPLRSITRENVGQSRKSEIPPAGQELIQALNREKLGRPAEPLPLGGLPEPQSKIIIGKSKEPFSFKGAWNKFYTGVVDKQKPIMGLEKPTGTDIGKLASNTRNVSGIVDYNILKGLVNKEGNAVGKSLKETVEAVPKGKEEDFWTYMSQRHNIDRAREGKPVQANYTPEMSVDAVKQIEEIHPEYKAIGDDITNWLDKFMKTWGVDTGIVNKDLYQELRQTYKSYFPTQRDFSTLEKAIPDGLSQKFVDQRSPIQEATGSKRDIIDPVENIMNLVNRTIRTAKYNEVGQSLLGSVRKDPEKMRQFAEVIPTKEGMFSNLDNVVTVLENGKPVYLKINDKPLLDALEGLPKNVNNVRFVTAATNMVKGLITQKNPIFAIRNIARDIPTAYVYGSEKNPFKFGAGLIGSGKDILANSPRLQRYQALGGGGANFFNSNEAPQAAAELLGRKTPIIQKVAHPLKTLGETRPVKAIEKFNNLTETAPRLAEFNRVLDKTGDVTKALHAANDVTVNFSRGGNITKKLDKWGGMYINASVQGLDKFFRGFSNPKVAVATLTKAGIAITAPDIALYLVNKDNPYYQKLDNRSKDAYFQIPNLADKDENGYAKTFIKIPKSRELSILFGSLFERIGRQIEGQQDSFKGFGNSVATNFAPANPFESSMYTPFFDLKANKDFADRAIVPQGMLMDKRSPYLQYDDKTTSIAKAIGEISSKVDPSGKGLSPKKLDFLIKSYSGVLGQLGIPLAVPGGNPLKALRAQFISDPVFSNQATGDFYDKLDKLSAMATDKNILEKIASKKLTPEEDIKNSMQGISSAISRGMKQANRIQASSDPNKDDQIRAVRKQILELIAGANAANDPRAMQLIENRANRIFKK